MAAETVAANWVAAIEAKHASVRVVVVARLIATHADEDGLVQISRNYLQKASHAGTCLDAAMGLKASKVAAGSPRSHRPIRRRALPERSYS